MSSAEQYYDLQERAELSQCQRWVKSGQRQLQCVARGRTRNSDFFLFSNAQMWLFSNSTTLESECRTRC